MTKHAIVLSSLKKNLCSPAEECVKSKATLLST